MGNGEAVAAAVTRYIGSQKTWPTTGGYEERVDLALINAVLTIQAQFGSQQKDGSFNGIRGAVERYRNANGGIDGGWMKTLASYEEAALIALTNRTKLNGRRAKASAIIEAAGAFVDRGLETRGDKFSTLRPSRL